MSDKKIIQLFIFPYAGGSAAAFKRLSDLIDEHVEVITVEYPGRGSRSKEPLADSLWDMLDDAISFCNMRRNINIPYAVMGYSMGSILAYEMLARNVIRGELRHFFVSAEVSPEDRTLELRKVQNPSTERILERAKQLGGLDERLLTNKRFSEIYIKPMVHDYQLFFEYRFSGNKEKLNVDTTFFYCDKDTSVEDVQKWIKLINGKYEFHEMGNNHFFINEFYREMAGIINKSLF